jgi:hypothetical protein
LNYPIDFTDDLRKKPICGVLSVAITARVTFAKATQAIKNNLMPWQKRHGGKTYHEQRINALAELGVQVREIPVRKQTLQRWVYENQRSGTMYMITTSTHCVTVMDDLVIDQYQMAFIDDHNSRRCFVRHVLEILK